MIAELSTRLNSQLNHLVEELAERTPARPHEQKTVSEHHEAGERERAIRRQIQYLQRVAAGLSLVAPATLMEGRVGFGSQVRVEDLQSGEIVSFTLMNGDGLDLDAGEISLASPVAQALLGRQDGDEVEVHTPQRTRRFRILSTTTLFDILRARDAPEIECA